MQYITVFIRFSQICILWCKRKKINPLENKNLQNCYNNWGILHAVNEIFFENKSEAVDNKHTKFSHNKDDNIIGMMIMITMVVSNSRTSNKDKSRRKTFISQQTIYRYFAEVICFHWQILWFLWIIISKHELKEVPGYIFACIKRKQLMTCIKLSNIEYW